MKIDRKIRVFISSKCGGNYSVGRKALKAMLEETGICEVYAFEKDYSSSMPVVLTYMSELKNSDVIIVFIDNADGVTDPVQAEINRARELKKKIIFIFCDEFKSNPTVLQEQLKENLLEKYEVCHEFSDFPYTAYTSFYNDITRHYRMYDLIDESTQLNEKDNIKGYSEDTFLQINKENFNGIKSVKNILGKMSGICFTKNTEYDGYDKEMGNLLLVLLGEKQLDAVDQSILDMYWNEIYKGKLSEIIEIRKKAFFNYLRGEYDDALETMEAGVEKYRSTIPRWMVNDIAIDMRYLSNYIAQRNGAWVSSNSKGQDVLDEDTNYLFNPLTDRFDRDFYKDIAGEEIDSRIESPDVIHIGGNEQVIDNLSKVFIAAVNCLSITHFISIRRKIINLFTLLSFKYRAHSLFISTIRMLIVERDEKNLKQYIESYGMTTNNISAEDVDVIQILIDNEKDFIKNIQSQSILLEFFAYYYEDGEFEKVINRYFNDVKSAIEHGIISTYQYIFNCLPNIERRVSIEKIIDILYLFLSKTSKRWLSDGTLWEGQTALYFR